MNLVSVQVGLPRTLGKMDALDPMDRKWTTGFYKTPVVGPVAATANGMAGDGQADLKVHGGHDKAINVYPSDHYAYWQKELGLKLAPGAFGENFTIAGAVESNVYIGDIFRVGDLVVQISQPRQPCWKLARRWRVKDLAVRVEQTGRTGWYFRVIEEGNISSPAEFILLERPHPEWTVELANSVMHHHKTDWQAASNLADCSALSESWKDQLARRVEALSPEAKLARPSDSE